MPEVLKFLSILPHRMCYYHSPSEVLQDMYDRITVKSDIAVSYSVEYKTNYVELACTVNKRHSLQKQYSFH